MSNQIKVLVVADETEQLPAIKAIEEFASELNLVLYPKDVLVEVDVVCNSDNATDIDFKKYGLVLFGIENRCKLWMKEAFEQMMTLRKETDVPECIFYFKDVSCRENVNPMVIEMKKRLKSETRTLPVLYYHWDEMKLGVLMRVCKLCKRQHINLEVQFVDNQVLLERKMILLLNDVIPVVFNKELNRLKLERKALLKQSSCEAKEKLLQLEKTIHEQEADLLVFFDIVYDYIATWKWPEVIGDFGKEMIIGTPMGVRWK